MTVFDIETGPLDRDYVLSMCDPFRPYCKPAPFDPSTVKIGNLKDQAKINAKIDEAEQKYNEDCLNSYPLWVQEKADYEEELLDKAALSAVTGQVLTIGYGNYETEEVAIHEGRESVLLREFWKWTGQQLKQKDGGLIGFYSNHFDMPFLIRRSWKLDLKTPFGIIDRNRFFNPRFIDLVDIFSMGCGDKINLDRLGKFLVGRGKSDIGQHFHRYYNGTPEEKTQAIDYAKEDIVLTRDAARKMGVM